MIDAGKFTPKTVYVIYIAATPEKVWQALTDASFTRAYFSGAAVAIEPKVGGAFQLLAPHGGVHAEGEVVDWSPPVRLSYTWKVVDMPGFRDLPACLVSYDIEPAGDAVRLTLTEAHQWAIPDALLSGGRAGWPAILSSLKSLVETGKSLTIKMQPPREMIEAIRALNH